MPLVRTSAFIAALLLLGGGYAASQIAFFAQTPADYAARVDTPAVKGLALVLLAVCIGSAIAPGKEEDSD